jgi:hypothetical protein
MRLLSFILCIGMLRRTSFEQRLINLYTNGTALFST